MNNQKKKEILQIAYRLAKDAFFLYILGGTLFLLAETVLPGIFSQRINFFFVYAGFLGLLGAVIALGRACGTGARGGQKEGRVYGARTQILSAIICAVLLLPIMRNVPLWVLPFLVVGTSVVCVMLMRHLLQEGNKKL